MQFSILIHRYNSLVKQHPPQIADPAYLKLADGLRIAYLYCRDSSAFRRLYALGCGMMISYIAHHKRSFLGDVAIGVGTVGLTASLAELAVRSTAWLTIVRNAYAVVNGGGRVLPWKSTEGE